MCGCIMGKFRVLKKGATGKFKRICFMSKAAHFHHFFDRQEPASRLGNQERQIVPACLS